MPKHRVSAALSWQNKIVDIHLKGLYKSKQYSDDANTAENSIDAYTTFDLQLSRPITSYLQAMIDIQDVFDNQHMETQTYLSPGRLVSVRLAVKF